MFRIIDVYGRDGDYIQPKHFRSLNRTAASIPDAGSHLQVLPRSTHGGSITTHGLFKPLLHADHVKPSAHRNHAYFSGFQLVCTILTLPYSLLPVPVHREQEVPDLSKVYAPASHAEILLRKADTQACFSMIKHRFHPGHFQFVERKNSQSNSLSG